MTYQVTYWCEYYMEEKAEYVQANSEEEACDILDAQGYEVIAATNIT
jgi:hypothetical protein